MAFLSRTCCLCLRRVLLWGSLEPCLPKLLRTIFKFSVGRKFASPELLCTVALSCWMEVASSELLCSLALSCWMEAASSALCFWHFPVGWKWPVLNFKFLETFCWMKVSGSRCSRVRTYVLWVNVTCRVHNAGWIS